jgi:predicted nucleic acid-binding protein
MTTSIDTNVIVALWDQDDDLNHAAEAALHRAYSRGGLTVCAPVWTELIAAPGRTEEFVRQFLNENEIMIDWNLNEAVWRMAGRAFQAYAERRRKQGEPGPRRILADFLIGAHSIVRGCNLLTLDERHYRGAFPEIRLEMV